MKATILHNFKPSIGRQENIKVENPAPENGDKHNTTGIQHFAETVSNKGELLELFDDIRALRHECESLKRASETQISLLRKAVDAAGDGAQALFEEVGKQRDDAVGALLPCESGKNLEMSSSNVRQDDQSEVGQ